MLTFICLCPYKLPEGSPCVSFIFASPAPGMPPTIGSVPLMSSDGTGMGNEWHSKDAVSSGFHSEVGFQWLTILLVWHFRGWSAGECVARRPECTSWSMSQLSQEVPQPQPELCLSSRGRSILNFEIVGCYFGTLKCEKSKGVPTEASFPCSGSSGLGQRWKSIFLARLLSEWHFSSGSLYVVWPSKVTTRGIYDKITARLPPPARNSLLDNGLCRETALLSLRWWCHFSTRWFLTCSVAFAQQSFSERVFIYQRKNAYRYNTF